MTYKGSLITNYIIDLITDNKASLIQGGIDAIYYGDQRIIGAAKVVCVEPTSKTRDTAGTGFHMQTSFETSIIVYVTSGQGVEDVQLSADQLTEAIEDLVNKKATPSSFGLNGDQLGGLITQGWVSSTEHGYRIPSSQLTRANRLLFTGISREPIFVA